MPAILAPGEATELDVAFNPAGQYGVVYKTVTVESDDPVQPSQVLTIQAEILPEVIPSMDRVLLQDLVPADRRKVTVKLASGTGKPLSVATVELSEAPWLGVAPREVGNDELVDFDLVARKLPLGKLAGLDTVKVHLDPGGLVVPLQVQWEARPPVTITPARVAWAEPAGQPLTADLVLKHRRGRSFSILSAMTSNPLLEVAWPRKAAALQKLHLVFAGSAKAGTYQEHVTVVLDSPGHPALVIPVDVALR